MPEALPLQQIERRLVELACPEKILRRNVRELAEHHDDLKQNALEEGLSEVDAEEQANRLLGEPIELAEQLAYVIRQSSWWGRHPVLGFCVFPPFAILFLFAFGLWLGRTLGLIYFTEEQFGLLMTSQKIFQVVKGFVLCVYFLAILFTAISFSQLSRRTLSGIKWTAITCIICALNGASAYVWIQPRSLSVGYGTQPDWMALSIPLVFGLIVWVRLHRAANQLLPLPAVGKLKPRRATKLTVTFRQRWITPTSVIAAIIFAAIITFTCLTLSGIKRQVAHEKTLHTTIWPVERAMVAKQLAARQSHQEISGETLIDLSQRVNMGLADLYSANQDMVGNDLAAFPTGTNIFGGVPFSVLGKVQLFGRTMADLKSHFPGRVKGIAINQSCKTVYLLHGAVWVPEGNASLAVAKLIFHYLDGSQAEVMINTHEHLLNWRGPIYLTGNRDVLSKSVAQKSELAWTGSNAWLKKNRPNESLRIYRSAIASPYPERKIVSIDYDSTLTDAAPFLLGMTVN